MKKRMRKFGGQKAESGGGTIKKKVPYHRRDLADGNLYVSR